MVQSVAAEKRALRVRMLERRTVQPQEKALALGRIAQAALLVHTAWLAARQVALYMPTRGEVDTLDLMDDAWTAGRQVLLPRCYPGKRGIIDFVPCTHFTDLRHGTYGILAPKPTRPALDWENPDLRPDVLVLPGAAFDRYGYRLGYGGGYYDRVLSRPALAQTLRVGLLYAWQVVDALPVDPWDMPVHCLCSEEGCQCL